MPRKTCTQCHGEKERDTEFHKDKSTRDGYRYWCKACAVPAALRYHHRNKEHVTQRNRKYKAKHPERFLLWCARHRAKKNHLEFDLQEADISIPDTCPILGIPLFTGTTHNPNSPSLDRIDNSKGYVRGNVQVISYRANVLKNSGTVEELIDLARWVMATYGA